MDDLTERQLMIVALIDAGADTAAIALELDESIVSVRRQILKARLKLRCGSMLELPDACRALGILLPWVDDDVWVDFGDGV